LEPGQQLIRPGGTRARAAQRGFTLLEIMVVVVIVGILVTGAIISLGATGKDSGLQQERDRLSALIDYTRERGEMLTLEYGIRCGVHGYRFVFYDNRLMRWSPEQLDETLRPRQLPSGLALDLQIEGRPIVLDDKSLKVNPQSAVPPGGTLSLLGSSSGMASITGSGGISGTLGSSGGFGAGSASSGLGGGASSGAYSSLGSGSGSGSSSGSIGPSGTLGSSSGGGSSGGTGLNANTDDNSPQLMLFSNGDTNTFLLTMLREGVGRSVTFQSSDDGTVKVGDIKDLKDVKDGQQ
jgi:type II secretion system protein H